MIMYVSRFPLLWLHLCYEKPFLKECLGPNCISLCTNPYPPSLVFFATSQIIVLCYIPIHPSYLSHASGIGVKKWRYVASHLELLSSRLDWLRSKSANHAIESWRCSSGVFSRTSNVSFLQIWSRLDSSFFQTNPYSNKLVLSAAFLFVKGYPIFKLCIYCDCFSRSATWLGSIAILSLFCVSLTLVWESYRDHNLQFMLYNPWGQIIGYDLFNFFVRTPYSPFFSSICDQLLCIPW